MIISKNLKFEVHTLGMKPFAACYFKEYINDQSETDIDSGLNVVSVAVVLVVIAIACNLKLLEVVQHQLKQNTLTLCTFGVMGSQFCSQYTF